MFLFSCFIPLDLFFLHFWQLGLGGITVFLLIDFVFLLPLTSDRFRVVLHLPTFVGRNQISEFSVELENRLTRNVAGLLKQTVDANIELLEPVQKFLLSGGETKHISVSFRPLERGEKKVLRTTARVLSPLQLWQVELSSKWDQSFWVLPNLKNLLPDRGLLAPRLSDMGIKAVRQRGAGTDFDSMRRYVAGDNYKDIDWRATSKRAQLMTRTYQVERNHEVLLAIDCGRRMGTPIEQASKLDWTMDAAMAVASFLLVQKDAVGVYLFGSKPQAFLSPKRDRAQLRRIAEIMAKGSLEKKETDFLQAATTLSQRRSKRMLTIFFTDFLDRETSLGLISGLFHLNRKHCILFVGVSDPFIPAAIESPLSPENTPFHKAVAFELKKNRLEVLDLLRKAGMSVLDLEPRQLTTPVLLTYLDLKLSNRL